ncbi:Splicing factor-like protein [Parasponia andersonii]|uniref:Splicing factor-like protein n=1 Tax=Parasponia andersonii TaxID=3476 RepID=A0A2P5A7K5_PARAD|nr:Splicing factor-like protein [Parasponia andersonii]
MMGTGGGGGRDRFRRDYQRRMEERSITHSGSGHGGRFGNSGRSGGVVGRFHGKSNAPVPPSRHLWVGNLAHDLGESELTHHFLRFGDLESVAFQPRRSYAFLNFVREEDAIDAIEALQGFPLAGNPLRIEFAKAVSLVLPNLLFSCFVISLYCTVDISSICVCLYISLAESKATNSIVDSC